MKNDKLTAAGLFDRSILRRENLNVFPTSPPLDGSVIDFSLPTMIREELSNGLKLIIIPDHDLPQVFFRIGLPVGEIHDPDDGCGAMELIAAMLRKGPAGMPAREFSDRIDRTGGYLSTAASNDFFYAVGDFLTESASEGFKLLADMLQAPGFLEDEFVKESRKLTEDLENEKSSPAYLAQKELTSRIYPGHPYGRFKDKDSIKNMNLTRLKELYRELFRPDGGVLVIAGDIDAGTARKLADRYFGKWPSRGKLAPVGKVNPVVHQRHLSFIERPGSQQVSLALGLPLFPRKHPDLEKVSIANHILGGGSTSRLFRDLREDKGYTYGAYSYLDINALGGGWLASAEVRDNAAAEAMTAFLQIITDLQNVQVDAQELSSAKRYKIGVFPVRHETVGSFARLALGQTLMNLEEDYWEQHIRRLDLVTAEDVQLMFRKYLSKPAIQLVVVGDREIAAKMGIFGEMSIRSVDDAGRSI